MLKPLFIAPVCPHWQSCNDRWTCANLPTDPAYSPEQMNAPTWVKKPTQKHLLSPCMAAAVPAHYGSAGAKAVEAMIGWADRSPSMAMWSGLCKLSLRGTGVLTKHSPSVRLHVTLTSLLRVSMGRETGMRSQEKLAHFRNPSSPVIPRTN